MFAKEVDCVLVGFEEAKEKLSSAKKVVITGNPTKIKKINISREEKKKILVDLGIKNELPIVLIFGGSQGAQAINEALVELIKSQPNEDYQIIWATGQNQYDIVKESFEKSTISIKNIKNVKVLPYIYNMEEMINMADLVICRSGAMTITELAICGKPAIFVPLPSRSANRQEDNARVLEKLGAARIILNEKLTGENLAKEINDIMKDKIKLEQMGKLANKIAPKDVEEKIYQEISKIVKNSKKEKNLQETDKKPTRNLQENLILEFCIEPKTLKEIVEYCGYKDIGNFREQYINPLIAQKKLQMMIPDQPNNRNQRYVNSSRKFFLKKEELE